MTTQSQPCMHFLAAHGHYVHSIPGRLRLELPALSGNPALARKIERQMSTARGIRSVSASTLTARLLIHYDQKELNPARIVALLHAIDCLPGCHHQPQQLANGLLDLAVEHALKLGAHLALGI